VSEQYIESIMQGETIKVI